MAKDPSIPRAAFWKDKIALRFMLAGILLMIFTVLWRINPAEGSVIPHFLKQNSFGTAVIYFLLATSTPFWICLLILSRIFLALGFRNGILPDSTWAVACIMIASQAIIYFMVGKLISFLVKKFSKKKRTL